MIRYLLDVNVLLAMIDADHVFHEAAHRWFASEENRAWATCPITENGVLRIAGNSQYPGSPGTPASVARLMSRLRSLPNHQFWPDDISLLSEQRVSLDHLSSASQVTDTYLLALAGAHRGRLATFDRRLVTTAVNRGRDLLHLIAE